MAVITTINEWIEEQDQNLFYEGVRALQQRWKSVLSPSPKELCLKIIIPPSHSYRLSLQWMSGVV